MFMLRPAAAIDPVSRIPSRSCAFPGPNATPSRNVSRMCAEVFLMRRNRLSYRYSSTSISRMPLESLLLLAAAMFVVATLYATVGHGGASGYLAVMALASMAPEVMRPTALALNILVASFTVYRFYRAKYLLWQGLWPFLLGSVPMAAVGGSIHLPRASYYAAVGVVLLASSAYLAWRAFSRTPMPERVLGVKRVPAIFIGAILGLLSGLTGVGGGIFLSPILLILKWAG